MRKLAPLLLLVLLAACNIDNSTRPAVSVSGFPSYRDLEVQQNPGNETGHDIFSISVRNAQDTASVTVDFEGLPAGVRMVAADYISDTYLSFDVIADATAPLGTHEAKALVSVDGRTHELPVVINVIPRKPTFTLEEFSVSRYSDYAPIWATITSTHTEVTSDVEFTASCQEDTYSNLRTYFRSEPVSLEAGETKRIRMPYSSGFPYFTRFIVRCSFYAEFDDSRVRLD